MILSLIDADSIIYVVAYAFRDIPQSDPLLVTNTCDSYIKRILRDTKATHYLGSFSHDHSFREQVYQYAPYKGNRPPKPEWIIKWKPIIIKHCVDKWGFIAPVWPLEADDIICGVSCITTAADVIICSPDKDLKQISGNHFNYKKPLEGIKNIDPFTANENLWKQVLIGDSGDNIKGVPGVGKAAFKLLKEGLLDESHAMYAHVIRNAYIKYFGEFFGNVIYEQTLLTVKLLQPDHKLWLDFGEYIEHFKEENVREVPGDVDILDDTMLRELGWFEE